MPEIKTFLDPYTKQSLTNLVVVRLKCESTKIEFIFLNFKDSLYKKKYSRTGGQLSPSAYKKKVFAVVCFSVDIGVSYRNHIH